MRAEEIIELVKGLEPGEIEKVFAWIKEYEAEVRSRQSSPRFISMDREFEKTVDRVFAENKELLQKLAEAEAEERKEK